MASSKDLHWTLAEEHRQKAGSSDDLDRAAGVGGGRPQAVRQALRDPRQAHVRLVVEQLERRDPGGDRERVARQRARLVDGARGREHAHQLGAAAERRSGQAAADHLAHDRQIGADAAQLLGAPAGDAEAADHLIEHEQRAGLIGPLAQQLEEPRARRHEPHVRRQRLGDDRRQRRARGRRR